MKKEVPSTKIDGKVKKVEKISTKKQIHEEDDEIIIEIKDMDIEDAISKMSSFINKERIKTVAPNLLAFCYAYCTKYKDSNKKILNLYNQIQTEIDRRNNIKTKIEFK